MNTGTNSHEGKEDEGVLAKVHPLNDDHLSIDDIWHRTHNNQPLAFLLGKLEGDEVMYRRIFGE